MHLIYLPVLVAELLWPSSEYWQGYCRGSSAPGKYCKDVKEEKLNDRQIHFVSWLTGQNMKQEKSILYILF